MKLLSLETATMNFPTIFRLSKCLQTHAPFMSIKSSFNPDWLWYNLHIEFGYVARLMPNSIRNFSPSLTSICPTVVFGFNQLEASKMEEFLAISDHMSCACIHWQLRSPINFFNFYLLGSPRLNTCISGIH